MGVGVGGGKVEVRLSLWARVGQRWCLGGWLGGGGGGGARAVCEGEVGAPLWFISARLK